MPAANKKRFTEQMLEKLRPPATGRLELADDLCPGLVLRVTDRGIKTFATIYRVAGEGGTSASGRILAVKQHRVTLGRWPALRLTDARDRSREVVASAKAGTDTRRTTAEAISARRENSFAAVLARHITQDASRTISRWRSLTFDAQMSTSFWTSSLRPAASARQGRSASICPSFSTGQPTEN